MVNGRAIRASEARRRAIRSSEAIRQERLRRTRQLRRATRPVVKRAQRRIQRGTTNIKRIFDPMG